MKVWTKSLDFISTQNKIMTLMTGKSERLGTYTWITLLPLMRAGVTIHQLVPEPFETTHVAAKDILSYITFLPTGNRRHTHQLPETRWMAESRSEGATKKWIYVVIFEEKSTISTRWLLLEEKKRWKNHSWRSHEIKGTQKKDRILRYMWQKQVFREGQF